MANGLVQIKITIDVPREELLTEWPERVRFRIVQGYEEMKGEMDLGHFEGLSWRGWHHHVTLVTLGYAFFMRERIGNIKYFWIDLASCPPMVLEIFDAIHGDMSNL